MPGTDVAWSAARLAVCVAWGAWGIGAPAPAAGEADEAALLERIEKLEMRIDDLEANGAIPGGPAGSASGAADWTRLVRLGGSANAGYYGGQDDAVTDPDSFQIWDARLFVDAQLGESVRLEDQAILRNVGFFFEWNLVRVGELANDVGELYVDLQGLLGHDALNLQLGRFQVPVGEGYLRYSRGTASNPFISHPVGSPWWWDEGIRLYGSSDDGVFGYVASLSDGDTPFNTESSHGKQGTLRLFTRPNDWLYASVSGLYSGRTGSAGDTASTALWLGEAWGLSFGAFTGVDNYQDGVVVPDGPNVLIENWLLAGDLIFDFEDKARIWLAYGRWDLNSAGGSFYDRVLHYWIAELVLRGAWLSEVLRPFYLGARGSGLGTFDDGEGYSLDRRFRSSLGYNMESLTAWSAVFGWELTRHLTLRAEYTFQDVDLVDLSDPMIRDAARDTDHFGIELGASF